MSVKPCRCPQCAPEAAIDREQKIEETRAEGPCPDFTIKWRKDQPPYVEVRLSGQLMVAGWVFPNPDGTGLKGLVCEPNPLIDIPTGTLLEGDITTPGKKPTLADRGISIPTRPGSWVADE